MKMRPDFIAGPPAARLLNYCMYSSVHWKSHVLNRKTRPFITGHSVIITAVMMKNELEDDNNNYNNNIIIIITCIKFNINENNLVIMFAGSDVVVYVFQ